MINEDFDLSDMSNIDYTDTFADIDDNAMKETVQKFIDEYVRIAYLDNN